MDNQNQKDDRENSGNSKWPFFIAAAVILIFMLISGSKFCSSVFGVMSKEVTYDQFLAYLNNDEVSEVRLDNNEEWVFKLKAEPNTEMHTVYLPDSDIIPLLKAKNVKFAGHLSSPLWSYLLIYGLPLIIMLVLFAMFFRRLGSGGGIMGVGRSTAKKHSEKNTGVTFADVAGEDEAKESLKEIVDFLHNPSKYTS
ncbi:MAG: ATP-dependent metallopeptidase FtsH/Yme1/Tma family protein, partial [Lachnospiraceae bacterium]|nr:ATP-dependent metallopeptidase FtsH/Yme1/Tma family protein [Lachnospiraceae bacterium]